MQTLRILGVIKPSIVDGLLALRVRGPALGGDRRQRRERGRASVALVRAFRAGRVQAGGRRARAGWHQPWRRRPAGRGVDTADTRAARAVDRVRAGLRIGVVAAPSAVLPEGSGQGGTAGAARPTRRSQHSAAGRRARSTRRGWRGRAKAAKPMRSTQHGAAGATGSSQEVRPVRSARPDSTRRCGLHSARCQARRLRQQRGCNVAQVVAAARVRHAALAQRRVVLPVRREAGRRGAVPSGAERCWSTMP